MDITLKNSEALAGGVRYPKTNILKLRAPL